MHWEWEREARGAKACTGSRAVTDASNVGGRVIEQQRARGRHAGPAVRRDTGRETAHSRVREEAKVGAREECGATGGREAREDCGVGDREARVERRAAREEANLHQSTAGIVANTGTCSRIAE